MLRPIILPWGHVPLSRLVLNDLEHNPGAVIDREQRPVAVLFVVVAGYGVVWSFLFEKAESSVLSFGKKITKKLAETHPQPKQQKTWSPLPLVVDELAELHPATSLVMAGHQLGGLPHGGRELVGRGVAAQRPRLENASVLLALIIHFGLRGGGEKGGWAGVMGCSVTSLSKDGEASASPSIFVSGGGDGPGGRRWDETDENKTPEAQKCYSA